MKHITTGPPQGGVPPTKPTIAAETNFASISTKTGQPIRAEEFTDELTTNGVSSGRTRSEDRLFS